MKKKIVVNLIFIICSFITANLNLYGYKKNPYAFLKRNFTFLIKSIIENKKEWKKIHKNYPFQIACATGDLKKVRWFLSKYKYELRDAVFMGHTPLQLATFFGNLEIVKVLVENGADINAKNVINKTARDLAREQYFPTIEKYLKLKKQWSSKFQPFKENAYKQSLRYFIKKTNMEQKRILPTLLRLCSGYINLPQMTYKKIILLSQQGEELEEIDRSFNEIQKFRESQIFEDKMIGAGGFGVVYTVKEINDFWLKHIPLATKRGKVSAIKQIQNLNLRKRRINDLVFKMKLEAGLLNRFFHKNIVTLFAVSSDELNIPILILKYYPGGDLNHYLFKGKSKLSKSKKIKFAKQIAQALKYLSDLDVIHRDLKSGNILIDRKGNLNLKITDFGLAKKKPKKLYKPETNFENWCVGKSGTLGYKAPEIIMNKNKYSTSADVFSFGIILYNISEQKRPYSKQQRKLREKIKERYEEKHADKKVDFENPKVKEILKRQFKQQFEQLILKGLRPKTSPDNIFKTLIADCMQTDPDKRPNFEDILNRLEKISKESL